MSYFQIFVILNGKSNGVFLFGRHHTVVLPSNKYLYTAIIHQIKSIFKWRQDKFTLFLQYFIHFALKIIKKILSTEYDIIYDLGVI
jgi:hypothetical protein